MQRSHFHGVFLPQADRPSSSYASKTKIGLYVLASLTENLSARGHDSDSVPISMRSRDKQHDLLSSRQMGTKPDLDDSSTRQDHKGTAIRLSVRGRTEGRRRVL